MAWNYEKGCEEPTAYKFGSQLYTPPNWGSEAMGCAREWEKREARAASSKRLPTRHITDTAEAICAWENLERAMNWQDVSKIPERRRQYLEWLAREEKVEVQMGFADVVDGDLPLMDRIIKEGFRSLSKTAHPDLGGSADKFRELKDASDKLKSIVAEVRDLL